MSVLNVDAVPFLPAADRREIVAQAIAAATGASQRGLNPLAANLAADGAPVAKLIRCFGESAVPKAFISTDLAAAVGDALRTIYLESARAPETQQHRGLCKTFPLTDFRETPVAHSEPISLQRIGQNGRIPPVLVGVHAEPIKLNRIGGIAPFTRVSLVNSEWNLLRSTTDEFIQAAYRAEVDRIVELLNENPVLKDGRPLFDVTRGNDDADSVENCIVALRNLKAPDGSRLHLAPGLIVVNPERELNIRQYLVLCGMNKDVQVVPLCGVTRTFVFPSPSVRPVLGLAHLDGHRQTVIDSQQHFSEDAWGIRGRFDFAVGAVSPYAVRSKN